MIDQTGASIIGQSIPIIAFLVIWFMWNRQRSKSNPVNVVGNNRVDFFRKLVK